MHIHGLEDSKPQRFTVCARQWCGAAKQWQHTWFSFLMRLINKAASTKTWSECVPATYFWLIEPENLSSCWNHITFYFATCVLSVFDLVVLPVPLLSFYFLLTFRWISLPQNQNQWPLKSTFLYIIMCFVAYTSFFSLSSFITIFGLLATILYFLLYI